MSRSDMRGWSARRCSVHRGGLAIVEADGGWVPCEDVDILEGALLNAQRTVQAFRAKLAHVQDELERVKNQRGVLLELLGMADPPEQPHRGLVCAPPVTACDGRCWAYKEFNEALRLLNQEIAEEKEVQG